MYKAVILQLSYTFANDEERYKFYKEEYDMLSQVGFDVEIRKATDRSSPEDEDMLIKALEGADVAVCLGNPPFSRRVIQSLPLLKIIQRCGIGLNSVDLEAATEYGKLVYYVPGYCIYELAEHCLGMILANLRNICFYDRHMRMGEWKKGEGPVPRRLSGLTVGLFGLGGSAAHLARMLHGGFGTKLIGSDPFVSEEAAQNMNVKLVDFETLVSESDIVSIHAPLNDSTRHIFRKDVFAIMKPDSMLINVARGGLIDYDDLAEALKNGTIGFAGLDTFAQEPMPKDHPLYALDNVVLTPHSAYRSEESTKLYKYLSAWLPIQTFMNNTVYLKQLANPDVLARFSGYHLMQAAPIPEL